MDPDQVVCELADPVRSPLTGERTTLNFLQTLSGTATAARRYAFLVAGINVLDIRKTSRGCAMPGIMPRGWVDVKTIAWACMTPS